MAKVGIPVDSTGLEGMISGHFGHANYFTIVEYDDNTGKIISVESKSNNHDQGGCMAPVQLLKDSNVQNVILRGIGGRPFMFMQQFGINAFLGSASTVKENFDLFLKNELKPIQQALCNHG